MRTSSTLACLLLVASSCALADDLELCVDTVAELEDAVGIARLAAPIPFDRVVAKVVQGTYNLSNSDLLTPTNTLGFATYHDLRLLGGYSAGCATRQLNATNTKLQNTNVNRRLYVVPNADVLLQGFHFENFSNDIQFDPYVEEDTQQRIEVTHNRFSGGNGPIRLGAESGNGTSWVIVKNNVIWNRSIAADECALELFGDTTSPDAFVRVLAANNTVALNGNGDGVCYADVQVADFYNNVFFQNMGADLKGSGVGPSLFYNQIGSRTTPGPIVNLSSSTANPQFNNAPGGDLRLQGTSPAVNSGFNNVPMGISSVDVAGNARIVGTAIDRGAHESLNSGLFLLSVTNVNNSGNGSLRDAITQANATPGLNGIVFNIPGSGCPKVIQLSTELPQITESLVIDGSSQPGSIANGADIGYDGVRCIAIRPTSGLLAWGLRMPSSVASTQSLIVDSLAFGGFTYAMYLQGGSQHRVSGSQFGGQVGSVSLPANQGGVLIASPDVQIGGPGPDERNVFDDSIGSGLIPSAAVLILNASDAEVINNYIGTSVVGGTGMGNTYGVYATGNGGNISDNLISYNVSAAIRLTVDASGYDVERNRIGLPSICFIAPCAFAGNGVGIFVEGSDNTLSDNLTTNSLASGVRITGDGNAVLRHRAYNNGGDGASIPPIDIAGFGYSANDNDGAATLPTGNRGINYPQLLRSERDGVTLITRIFGRLESTNGDYLITMYVSNRQLTGQRCEGRTVFAQKSVTISNALPGQNGSINFDLGWQNADPPEQWITATATRKQQDLISNATRLSDTSEYGNCLVLPLFADGFDG